MGNTFIFNYLKNSLRHEMNQQSDSKSKFHHNPLIRFEVNTEQTYISI